RPCRARSSRDPPPPAARRNAWSIRWRRRKARSSARDDLAADTLHQVAVVAAEPVPIEVHLPGAHLGVAEDARCERGLEHGLAVGRAIIERLGERLLRVRAQRIIDEAVRR